MSSCYVLVALRVLRLRKLNSHSMLLLRSSLPESVAYQHHWQFIGTGVSVARETRYQVMVQLNQSNFEKQIYFEARWNVVQWTLS